MARPYIGGSNAAIMAVSSDTTFTTADHGKTIVLDASAELNLTMTLPATATSIGMEFDFVIGVASHAASEVLITSDTNIVGGLILNATGAVTAITSGASRGFGNGSDAGSRFNIVCDGTQWIILNANSDVAFVTGF
jgi:hypothetical protein